MDTLNTERKKNPSRITAPFGGSGDRLRLGLQRSELIDFLASPILQKTSTIGTLRKSRLPQNCHFFEASAVRKHAIENGLTYNTRKRTAHRIAFTMCKGGVGKTTLSYFLGVRLASYGARVLFVDSDPQSNLTHSLKRGDIDFSYGPIAGRRAPVLVDVLAGRVNFQATIQELYPNLHLVPSTAVNSMLERDLLNLKHHPVQRLDKLLQEIEQQYDFIIIDCAPTLNIFNASVGYAAHTLILPFQLSEYSKIGLQQTVSEIQDLEKEFKFRTQIRAVLNIYRPGDMVGLQYLTELKEMFRNLFFDSVVRESVDIQRALKSGENFFMDENSMARKDLDSLTQEIFALPQPSRELNAQDE